MKNSLPGAEPPPVVPGEELPLPGSPLATLTGFLRLQWMLDRALALKGLMRLQPFDTSTQQGRSRERYRRAALTALASVAARAVTIVTSLLTVRLTIRYLGAERYGLWMTATSVVSLLMFADFGIGNGLMTNIS